ncbi:MAG: hypothetical protein ACKV2T_17985 [Kofleriaceae bacterium]
MRSWALSFVAVTGCSFNVSVTPVDDGGGMVDANACAQWRPEHVDPCMLVTPRGLDLVLSGTYVYDTELETLVDPMGATVDHASEGQPSLVIVVADHLTVAATSRLRAVGTRPLMIVAWTTIVVDGSIDVSSRPGQPGAGVGTAECTTPSPGENDVGGAGGGGGGGFGAAGGKGGDGDSNLSGGNDGTGLGASPGAALALPARVHAGCGGGDGGGGTTAQRGRGGMGGGALELVARDSITVRGTLHAGGQGGTGTSNDGGGGGGGSGGYLGLDAPVVILDGGTLAANGGAGAGGGDDGNVGELGEDGRALEVAATGGIGGLPGGTRGGDGGVAGAEAGRSVTITNTGGGGGGGGGAGMILVWSPAFDAGTTATISPAAITNP